MSRKTLQAAVMAVVGDRDSDSPGTESELFSEGERENGKELDSDREPDQGESYTGRSSFSPLASSDSLTPYRYSDQAGSNRTPLRRLQNSCPRLSVPTTSGSKTQSRSLIRPSSGDQHDYNPSKKKRANIAEQENFASDNEQSCEEESVTTNALLVSLIKRLDRQEKRLSEMQHKIDQAAVVPSSSSSGRTPNRASRRKEVPLEVRVSSLAFTYIYLVKCI